MTADPQDLEDLPPELAAELKSFHERGRGTLSIRAGGAAPPSITVGGYDHVLLAESERGALRAVEAAKATNATLQAGATASAVLCGAAACEARLSEYLARVEFHEHGLVPELQALRSEPDAREQWRKLLALRAPQFKPGESRLFLELGCLFKVRDHIAHRHARLAPAGSFPPKLADCIRQGIVPARAAAGADWTSVVFVHEVATWAYRTAKDWVEQSEQLLPISC
jgi:hypothetical protein